MCCCVIAAVPSSPIDRDMGSRRAGMHVTLVSTAGYRRRQLPDGVAGLVNDIRFVRWCLFQAY
jgi:hypothetical protein